MKDKTDYIPLLRALAAVVLVMAVGMIAARLAFGFEISFAVVLALLTIATSNLAIAADLTKKAGKPD
ncbi:hypothetical protein [Erythrobacter oryzae]|uniref:hypothetical protein n=1 Tax=Erythrobacter oryzae TaxID=3019556 RepID=UPI0025570BB5|nr:hypothetical protein [Erythrobacter sp. COR-2]